jgi:hypothetical protein
MSRRELTTMADAMMLDYEIIRGEVIEYQKTQNSIVNIGLATIGVLFSGGLSVVGNGSFEAGLAISNLSVSEVAVRLDFCFLIPAISLMILIYWFGEVVRMLKMGEYLNIVETLIKHELEDLTKPRLATTIYQNNKEVLSVNLYPFQWETWQRDNSKRAKFPYVFILALFHGIAFISPFLGIFFNQEKILNLNILELLANERWWILPTLAIDILLASILFNIARKFK